MSKEAMFGAGCFWGVQSVFDDLKGVIETEVGYTGGSTPSTGSFDKAQDKSPQAVPTYKEVCTGKTGHAETVHLMYDPSVVSYEELLKVFFEMHDPTTMNRQGPDIGSQYRSIIFYFDNEQKESAENYRENLNKSGKYKNPAVTEIVRAQPFYRAEEYHQKYFEKTGQKVCN